MTSNEFLYQMICAVNLIGCVAAAASMYKRVSKTKAFPDAIQRVSNIFTAACVMGAFVQLWRIGDGPVINTEYWTINLVVTLLWIGTIQLRRVLVYMGSHAET